MAQKLSDLQAWLDLGLRFFMVLSVGVCVCVFFLKGFKVIGFKVQDRRV